jgi:Taurine catabolism dioxygenase TauD, TfdA family
MSASREWAYRLSEPEVDEIRELARRLDSEDPTPEVLRAHSSLFPLLTPRIRSWAEELRAGRGFVLVRGFPVNDLSEREVTLAYVAIGHGLGRPTPQNTAGDLVGHVRDDGSDPEDPTVRRYRTRLEQPFHVDGSDVVGLLCLRRARSGGISRIVSSVTIYDEIVRRRPDLEPLLRENWCFDSYGQQAPGAPPWFERPILTGTDRNFRFFHLRWYIDKAQENPNVPRLTGDRITLLDLIDALADDPELHLDMEFAPGDIQLLSNHTVLHARTAYEDHTEGSLRRHLLRLWLMWPSEVGG